MGGVCETVIEGETAEDIAKKGGEHVMTSEDDAHKEVKEKMSSMSQEDSDKWMEDFKKKFDEKA